MFVDSSPVTVTFELFISSYDNWQGRRAGAQVGWRIKNSYASRHAFTFEALNNSKCFKVHAWISHVFVRVLLWQVGHCFGAEEPMRMFNAVPWPAKRGSLLLHRAVGPATQERQLLLHIHACHAHENKIQFAIIGGTTKKLHDKTSQAQVDSASHYSCFSLLFIVFCFSFFVRLIVHLWRPLISFTLPLESLELFQGQAQFPPPLHNHTMIEKRWKWTGLGKHSNKWHQRTFFGATNKWGLSWAQVYKRLNALCWGCRRTIHTLILQALNHLLKALRRQ